MLIFSVSVAKRLRIFVFRIPAVRYIVLVQQGCRFHQGYNDRSLPFVMVYK
ncbi:hypothetical protein [Flavobacterium sp. WV_118_3]|uniref:hypothetical protein n=1 Tax=Flavobacterium sp. WV_118_3 TaxID=3151764 RepID=UPI00321BA061